MPEAIRNLTPAIPARKPRGAVQGEVCALTRHPTALATALATISSHRPRYAVARLMEVLVMNADREGVWWGKTTKECERLTGLSRNTIKVAARDARRFGWLEWMWIKTRQRYPKRVDYKTPVVWGKGRNADNGGRVWVVQWKALGVPWTSRDLAAEKRLICVEPGSDQSRVICTDQSHLMDLSLGSSNLRNDPAAAGAALGDGPEAPAQPAGAVPSVRQGARPDLEPTRAPAAPAALPETSRAAVAAGAAPPGPAEIERQRGVEGSGDGEPEAVDVEAERAAIAACWAQIRALGARRPPVGP